MGVSAKGGSMVMARQSDFANLYQGFGIFDMAAPAPGMPFVEDCNFSTCRVGVNAANSKQAYVRGSNFQDCRAASIALEGIGELASVSSCNIVGTGMEALASSSDLSDLQATGVPTYGLPGDAVFFETGNRGIFAHECKRLQVSGSLISDCKLGIAVPADSKTNMVLSDQTTVEQNTVGIFVVRGHDDLQGGTVQRFGMVMLDCARLLDNHVGVLGQNVLLEMDAYANSGSQLPSKLRSNHFRRLSASAGNVPNRLFSVCYDAAYAPPQIFARGNYWENLIEGVNWRLQIGAENQCGANFLPSIALDRAGALATAPTGCAGHDEPGPGQGGDPNECPQPPLDPELTHSPDDRFFKAYRLYSIEAAQGGAFEGSSALFQPLANVKNQSVEGMSDKCRKYVGAARAFVRATLEGKPEERQAGAAGAGLLSVRPNPATDALWVSLPEGSGPADLRLWDAQGRLVAERPAAEGPQRFDVGGLPPGLYWVEARYGSTRLVAKAVIRFFD